MKRLLLTLFLYFIITAPSFAIKIGLQDGVRSTKIGTSVDGSLIDKRENKILYNTKAKKAYEIRPYGRVLAIRIGEQFFKLDTNIISLQTPEHKQLVSAKRRWYRGELIIINYNGKLIVINNLPLEQYLLGVIPSEMPSRWNYEAHRAQAIAARSYAIANLGKRKSHGYDLLDTPHDQAYGGASSETLQTNRAIVSTKDIVITYNNKVIPAYYHAASGGQTVQSGVVWSTNLPYLKSVNGQDWGIRKSGHGVGMSQYGANNLANKGYSAPQILNYYYNNIAFARVKSTL